MLAMFAHKSLNQTLTVKVKIQICMEIQGKRDFQVFTSEDLF